MSSRPHHFHKTRIAPTPSGFLHVGNVLSFSITAALARKTGAKILLRIDDMDQTRADARYIQGIFDTLNFLEIPWDQGPANADDFEKNYSQVHRLNLYNEALEKLYDNGLIYGCECSRKQLATQSCRCADKHMPFATPDVSWRLKTDGQKVANIKDYTGNLIQTTLPPEMENFVVKRRDGLHAYQLTSIIDDLFYGVDLVVRGQDLWSSTVAQHYLAFALGEKRFADITFYHHPLLMESPGKKLSKSAGSTSIKYMREQGKTAADIFGTIGDMLGIDGPVMDWQQLEFFLSS
jgi:glutamyl-tRNA synthetase